MLEELKMLELIIVHNFDVQGESESQGTSGFIKQGFPLKKLIYSSSRHFN